jgi:hypothetical protein
MKPITVYCGNGGDYEFERDRAWWRIWVNQHMPNADPFIIVPHEDADKAYIIFEAAKWNPIFLMQAPEFISSKHIDLSEYGT